jgi:hypothetical protein
MPRIRVYLDENVPACVQSYLMQRQIPVTTAQHEQTRGFSDEEQLRYATSQGLVLLTTNVRHFHRWHHEFRANGWEHGGIITVPQDDLYPQRLHIRSTMLVAWAETFATTRNVLFRWTDLQSQLYRGATLSGFNLGEIDYAIGKKETIP